MKIRLASINGRIGDPLYNESLLEKEIDEAIKEGIELLVFPENEVFSYTLSWSSFLGYSKATTYKNNQEYIECAKKADKNIADYIEKYKDVLDVHFCSDYIDDYNHKGYNVKVRSENRTATLEYLSNIEEEIAEESKDNTLVLYCCGNGTNSVCKEVMSNAKIIAYNGKILASDLFYAYHLDFSFNDNHIYTKAPYLDRIKDRYQMFKNILQLQGIGLYGKMKSMNRFKICLGVSGGLDSTCVLLACVQIFAQYNIPLKNIIGVTMPGLGTTERTYKNALSLMQNLGITVRDIDLKPLLKTHLNNIEQPEGLYDITYEQTQSRERTQVLLDIANQEKAIMIGTGCMSEFALGWMTYGGDHLSMYALNIGLPKTVVRLYTNYLMNLYNFVPRIKDVILDILEGPVSPELLPIDENGEQHEKTESLIGDYIVQDFFIYHMTVNNYSIKRIFEIACEVFKEKYEPKQLLKWLEIFTLRYFTRAYKKNCYGDGLQLFEYCVAPWKYDIPSDIDNSIWQAEIEELKNKLMEEEVIEKIKA